MRRTGWIAVLALLGSGLACGQQTKAARPASKKTAPSKAVTVHKPGSGVTKPRLLPLTPPVHTYKDCKNKLDGETELSLLVDTKGMARNVMFLKPAGTPADLFAVAIAELDRFQPGTLNGKPVVVAETLRVRLQICVVEVKKAGGQVLADWGLRSQPRQKLSKPKDPPLEAVFAPAELPAREMERKVKRPDFFGNNLTAPVLLYSTPANYTPSRKKRRIKGVCKISLIVDTHGLPLDEHVLKPLDPGLDKSALEAVRMYRFFPAIKNNNEPVPAAIVVDVNFAPPGARNAYDR